MRTFRTSLAVMLAVLFANSQAFAMSVEQSRNEAWFLTDKMAHELRLSSYQWDDVYEVNYDFFRALGSVYSSYTNLEYSREQKLMYILTVSQWNEYRRITYFYNPVVAVNGSWTFRIYNHYAYDKFFDRNHAVVHSYTGNHSNNSNYYHNRHVTTNQGNHYGNYNNNGNHNGNHNNMGNGNNHNNSHNNMNYGNNGNRNNNNNSNHNGTLASRTPSTGNSASSHVTQNTSRRH